MKIAFGFFVASLLVLGAYGWIRQEYSPASDPILKRLKYDCLPREFNIGPMKANEIKYVLGNYCATVSCNSAGVVIYLGCQIPVDTGHCTIEPGKLDRHYPECCEVAVC